MRSQRIVFVSYEIGQLMIKTYERVSKTPFYAPGLKGLPGASSNRIVRPSVCPSVRPSVCLSVRLSVIPSRLQTKSNN